MQQQTTSSFFRDHGDGWRMSSGQDMVAFILAPLVGVWFIAGGVYFMTQGTPRVYAGPVVILLGFLIGTAPLLKRKKRQRPVAHVHEGVSGTLIRFRRAGLFGQIYAALFSLIGLLLFGGGILVIIRDGEWTPAIYITAFGVFLASAMIGVAIALGKQRKTPARGVFVSSEGVALTASYDDPITIPWSSIDSFQAHWKRDTGFAANSGRGSIINYLTVHLLERPGVVPAATEDQAININHLTCNPYAVLEALQLYLDNSSARQELGAEAANRRFSGK